MTKYMPLNKPLAPTKHYKLNASAIKTWDDLQRLIDALDVRFTNTFPRLDTILDLVEEIDSPDQLIFNTETFPNEVPEEN